MQENLQNRQQSGIDTRGAKVKKITKPKEPKQGRPPVADRQPEVERDIVHDDGKTTIEHCPLCGRKVKMRVYSVKDAVRYATCPGCARKVALTSNTARPI